MVAPRGGALERTLAGVPGGQYYSFDSLRFWLLAITIRGNPLLVITGFFHSFLLVCAICI